MISLFEALGTTRTVNVIAPLLSEKSIDMSGELQFVEMLNKLKFVGLTSNKNVQY